MKFQKALKEVCDALRVSGIPQSRETIEAMHYLESIGSEVETIAGNYIEGIDHGPLNTWIEANEKQWPDLDDQRLFDSEERSYSAAHSILGIPLEWPQGYEET